VRAFIVLAGCAAEAEVRTDDIDGAAVVVRAAKDYAMKGDVMGKFQWCVTRDMAQVLAERQQMDHIAKVQQSIDVELAQMKRYGQIEGQIDFGSSVQPAIHYLRNEMQVACDMLNLIRNDGPRTYRFPN
jgi:hypothetical protein